MTDSARKRARATAHTKHVRYCSCGKVVRGNGGRAGHAYMHERRADGGQWVSRDWWLQNTTAGLAEQKRLREQHERIAAMGLSG